MNTKMGKFYKIVAIIFMAMTAAMNLLGGAGTVCAAFLTKQYPPMWSLLDYQWLYQFLMITTILTGIAGIWATIKLIRGGATVYRNALIVLIIGSLLSVTQYIASMLIRGAATPANVKFYTNFITLLIFLAFKLPALRERVDFTSGTKSKGISGGLAAFVAGTLVLSTFAWVPPSHTYQGDNWVLVLEIPLMLSGFLLLFGGLITLIQALFASMKQDVEKELIENKGY